MKYFAYGSNLSKNGMKERCPNSKKYKKYTLKGYRLTFRGRLPDILPEEDGEIVGGLWEITESDEAALDIFEGYNGPSFSNLYNKHFTEDEIMFYRMASSEDSQPENDEIRNILIEYYVLYLDGHSIDYIPLNSILTSMIRGLNDFGITVQELRKSLGFPT